MRRVGSCAALLACWCIGAAAWAQAPKDAAHAEVFPDYTEVFYPSADLKIQAYLYKPEGKKESAGPFAAVIYTHGARDGQERDSVPYPFIASPLVRAGYVVLVTERRGYGKSGGRVWWQETAGGKAHAVMRLEVETADVLAAADYLRTLPYVDAKRIGVMGWSGGGVITLFATTRTTAFAASVNQAGGALSWDSNQNLQTAMMKAAKQTTTPTLFLVARNDRTTASMTTLADIFADRGVPHRLVVYPPVTASDQGYTADPAGHRMFSEEGGVAVWEKDVLEFLGRYLAPGKQ